MAGSWIMLPESGRLINMDHVTNLEFKRETVATPDGPKPQVVCAFLHLDDGDNRMVTARGADLKVVQSWMRAVLPAPTPVPAPPAAPAGAPNATSDVAGASADMPAAAPAQKSGEGGAHPASPPAQPAEPDSAAETPPAVRSRQAKPTGPPPATTPTPSA